MLQFLYSFRIFIIIKTDIFSLSSLLAPSGAPYKKEKLVTLLFIVHYEFIKWSHLGSNQGPPDYESGALTS